MTLWKMAGTAVDRRRVLTMTLSALAAGALPATGRAASAAYPERPIRVIVPFPAAGAADVMARGLTQRLGEELRQQVIVDNRGGAGGTVAAEAAANAAADGYTLFFATMGTHAINATLYPKLRYDPVKGFAPISLTHTTPRVLVVGSSLPVNSVADLVARARARPGGLTYGSAGSGSSSHLSAALFALRAGIEMLHVPYRGSAPLLIDVVAGRIDLTFDSYTVYEESIRNGKVRALAVTSKSRMSALPEVPTIAESGIADYEVSNWLGLLAPAGTPPTIIATLNAAVGRAMATPALREQLKGLGIEPAFTTPEAFAALIRAEIPKWAEIVKKSGATAD
jgi:tripartite-type tricarboxylate transporter receptor subunit TctC